MIIAETSDHPPTDNPPELSPERMREIIINTRLRLKNALYELKQAAAYGELEAEIINPSTRN